jgi:2,3-bisphosphoglycerate-independent phosphoglycerate mutase
MSSWSQFDVAIEVEGDHVNLWACRDHGEEPVPLTVDEAAKVIAFLVIAVARIGDQEPVSP